jgi:hypothetical protein
MYSLFVQLGDGEFLQVASRNDLEEAVQLMDAFRASWPREYVVRDSDGNDVDPTEQLPIQSERSAESPIVAKSR